MKRSLSDKLVSIAPPKVGGAVETISDFDRILNLPRRPAIVCEPDEHGVYPPATQALIEVMTEKFSRGPRLSCACRPRKVRLSVDGVSLLVTRVLPEDEPADPPLIVSRQRFLDDQRGMLFNTDVMQKVVALEPEQEIELPAADGVLGHPCITTLNPVQSWFLREAMREGGAVGFMGVGSGKSIAFLLAPLCFPQSKKAVLLIEPKQRAHYRSQYLRLREHFKVSSIAGEVGMIHGSTVPGTPPLHLVSYSILSRTENSDLLERLDPDVLLLDEEHRACGKSAINLRIKRFCLFKIKQRQELMVLRQEVAKTRSIYVLGGSGTLEVKSVNDTQMICAYSLGTGSPLPLDINEAEAWSAVMDDSAIPDRKSMTARRLWQTFGYGQTPFESPIPNLFDDAQDIMRRGFQKWRTETPGIISASAPLVKAAIYFSERETPEMPKVVREALRRVRLEWERPDGEEFIEKMAQLACARTVGCGFYNYWAFPKHICTCKPDRRCDECELITLWFLNRKLFNKELRSLLLKGMVQLDSEKLCREAAKRAKPGAKREIYCATCEGNWPCAGPQHKPAWLCESWPAWAAIENRVDYEERVRWLGHDSAEAASPKTHPGYFLARDAAKWALDHRGVVWFQSVALGRKIAELSGLPYFNGGPGGEDRLRAEKGDRSIICSISAHGAGTDGLQNLFNQQLIVEMPSSNATSHGMEQILGRLTRRGQKADVVNTFAYLHTEEFKDALRKTIQQAEFNLAMTKNRQMILMADMDVDEL